MVFSRCSLRRFLQRRQPISFPLALALLAFPAAAGAQVVGGSITGSVSDASGAAVPHASVVVRNQNTGTERRLVSDDSGQFSAPSIPVGTYSITVESAGFAPLVRTGIDLAIG